MTVVQSLGTRVGLGRGLVTAGKTVGVHVPVPVQVSGEEEREDGWEEKGGGG